MNDPTGDLGIDRLTASIMLIGLVATIAFPVLVAWSIGAIRRRR